MPGYQNPNQNKNRGQSREFRREEKEFDEKIIEIKRVSKKTKGGNKISFSCLVVVGDHKGRAGVGFSKAPDVLSSIKKSVRRGKKNMITIEIVGDGSIAHQIMHKRGAAKVLLKPAPEGTGVISGSAVRAVIEAFGIKNIVTKCLGTSNKASNVYATFEALQKIKKTGKTQVMPEIKKEDEKEPRETKK